MKRRFAAAALLAVVTLAAYGSAFRASFVLDDAPLLVQLERGASAFRVLLLERKGGTTAGRPVTAASWALNLVLAGASAEKGLPGAWGFHVANVAFHLGAVLALWLVAGAVLERIPELAAHARGVALASSTLFAVHPLTTAAVTYAAQRAEVLMALFLLLSLWAALRAAAGSRLGLLLAGVSAWLSVMSKEVGAVLPLVFLLLDRALLARSFAGALRRRRSLYLVLASSWVPFLALAWTGPRGDTAGWGAGGLDPASYLFAQGRAITGYLALVLWPSPLILDHGWPLQRLDTLSDLRKAWVGYGWPFLAVSAALLATVWGQIRHPRASLPFALSFVLLAPSSSFVPIATEIVAEHRMYLPLGILLVSLVAGACWLLSRPTGHLSRPRRWFGATTCAAVALALGVATVHRNWKYQNPTALWEENVRETPGNPRAMGQLAAAYLDAGQIEQAERTYRDALDVLDRTPLAPRYVRAHLLEQLGRVEELLGRPEEALTLLQAAVAADPEGVWPHYRLTRLLARLGRPGDAIAVAQAALARHPDHLLLKHQALVLLLEQRRIEEARALLTRGGELSPQDPQITRHLISVAKMSGLPSVALRLRRDLPRELR